VALYGAFEAGDLLQHVSATFQMIIDRSTKSDRGEAPNRWTPQRGSGRRSKRAVDFLRGLAG